jgi:hypothetical protein
VLGHSCVTHESALQLLRGGQSPRLRSPGPVRSPRVIVKSEERQSVNGNNRRSSDRRSSSKLGRQSPRKKPVVTDCGELNDRFNEMHFHGGNSAMANTRGHCLANTIGAPLGTTLNRSVVACGKTTNPLNASTWEKKLEKQVVPIDTLDRVGTRAACPVHLLNAKPASYAHVSHKVDTPQRGIRKLAWGYPTPRPTEFLDYDHGAWR